MMIPQNDCNELSSMTIDDYCQLLPAINGKENVIGLIRSVEISWRVVRWEYGQVPSDVMDNRVLRLRLAYQIWLVWQAMATKIPTATFEDAKLLVRGYYPSIKKLVWNAGPLRKSTIDKFPNIESFACNGNNITSLDSITGLSKLRKLNCCDNRISTLEPIFKMSNLTVINFTNNKIKRNIRKWINDFG